MPLCAGCIERHRIKPVLLHTPVDMHRGLCRSCVSTARDSASERLYDGVCEQLAGWDKTKSIPKRFCGFTWALTGVFLKTTRASNQGQLTNPDVARAARAGHIVPASQGGVLAITMEKGVNILLTCAVAEHFIGNKDLLDLLYENGASDAYRAFLSSLNLDWFLGSFLSSPPTLTLKDRLDILRGIVTAGPMDLDLENSNLPFGTHVDPLNGDIIEPPGNVSGNPTAPPIGAGAFGGVGFQAPAPAPAPAFGGVGFQAPVGHPFANAFAAAFP